MRSAPSTSKKLRRITSTRCALDSAYRGTQRNKSAAHTEEANTSEVGPDLTDVRRSSASAVNNPRISIIDWSLDLKRYGAYRSSISTTGFWSERMAKVLPSALTASRWALRALIP